MPPYLLRIPHAATMISEEVVSVDSLPNQGNYECPQVRFLWWGPQCPNSFQRGWRECFWTKFLGRGVECVKWMDEISKDSKARVSVDSKEKTSDFGPRFKLLRRYARNKYMSFLHLYINLDKFEYIYFYFFLKLILWEKKEPQRALWRTWRGALNVVTSTFQISKVSKSLLEDSMCT